VRAAVADDALAADAGSVAAPMVPDKGVRPVVTMLECLAVARWLVTKLVTIRSEPP